MTTEVNREQLIKRMKDALIEIDRSQSDMARGMKVSRQVISRWFVTGAVSDARLEDIAAWLNKHGANVSASQLKYGDEARPNESYLSLVIRTINDACREAGVELDEEHHTQLIDEFYASKISPQMIRRMITHLAGLPKKDKAKPRRRAA